MRTHTHHLILTGIPVALACSPMNAQDMALTPAPQEELQASAVAAEPSTEIVSTEENQKLDLPPAEQKLRAGVILLHSLAQTMAGIKDKETADAAVPAIMRYSKEFPAWAQSFNALPPMEEMEQIIYEDQYLPLIENLNQIIKAQASRLAAAEYYNSTNLLTALVHLALINQ